MKALIFAAGLGTRLRPLTDDRPKALVEVGGRSLLEWQLLTLSSFGFKDIVINVHHFGQMVEDAVREFFEKNPHCGLKVQFSEEFDLLRDTGGGIRHAASLLSDGEPFLVHNVDILSDLDLKRFYKSCCRKMKSSDVVGCVVVSGRYSDRRLLFDSAMRLKGWENIKTGEIKPPFTDIAGLKPYAFGGIHVLSPRILEIMKSWEEKFSIVDFYLSNAADWHFEGRFIRSLELIDVGRLEHLPLAEEFLKRKLVQL